MSVSGKFCARPVNPFGRGRPWLRWTRALCKFNWGKGGSGGVPRLCCRAQPGRLASQKLVRVKEHREDYRCRGGKKRSVGSRAREIGSVRRHAEFLRWREWFHAAGFIRGGDRNWISAAVSLSITFMGPPHLGQR